ncbi:MAG TPA: hypothetical protein VFB69_02720 [Candidatus Dormibacteraeota bacterium]|nr:hypothetical protein [Candidatus Dormibacteraeota bacterium]
MTKDYSPLRALFTIAPNLQRADGRVLTVYLPAHRGGFDNRWYDIEFADLRHRYYERLGNKELAVLEAQLPRLHSRLALIRPAGVAGIAGFAQAEPDLLDVITLPLPTDERLQIGDPLLAPALRQLEAVPPALVAVVDKEDARLFGFILGHTFETADVSGIQVHHSRVGGPSAASNQRKADNRTRMNVEYVAFEVARELSSGAYARLFIAGPQEARAEFERRLAEPARRLLAGHLGASLDSATLQDDLRRALLAVAALAARSIA